MPDPTNTNDDGITRVRSASQPSKIVFHGNTEDYTLDQDQTQKLTTHEFNHETKTAPLSSSELKNLFTARPFGSFPQLNKQSTGSQSLFISQAMQVVYKDINYEVQITDKKTKKQVSKPILKGISGVFQPGRFTAVMGSSGAGKTSLLNVVAGRSRVGTYTGSIMCNGVEVDRNRIRSLSAFVFQDDVILDTMTVKEALTMSASLRLPESMSITSKLARVEEVLDVLHLRKCADTVIGNATQKGISGGEKRRVSLGIELITNPSILFLDEPTSGLDTFTAHTIIHILKNLAHHQQRTIVCTIHQPSSDIFHMFDDLVLLADGQCMYSGPAQHSINYFSRCGYPCPVFTNPADYFFMSVLNAAAHNTKNKIDNDKTENTTNSVIKRKSSHTTDKDKKLTKEDREQLASAADKAEQDRINSLLKEWKNSGEYNILDEIVNNLTIGKLPSEHDLARNTSGFGTQFNLLFQRSFKNATRNQLIVKAKLGQTIFISLIVGLIYLRLGDSQQNVQDRQGSLFFLCVNCLMGSVMAMQNTFGGEKLVFLREYSSGMYSLPAYFLARMAVELPIRIIFPLLAAVIQYWMIGYQNQGDKFIIFAVIFILLEICGSSLGVWLTCLFPNLQVALAITPMIMLPIMIFSGFFVNSGNIPPYFDWISYISPVKYGFMAAIKNEFEGLSINCEAGEVCRWTQGTQVISQLGFYDQPSLGVDLVIVAALSCGFLFGAFVALWRATKKTI